MIVNDLQKIGVRVRLLSLEFNSIVSKLTSTLDWEAVILGVTGSVEPHFGANVWLSNGSLHFWYLRQNKPQTAWEARIDQLFKEALESFDDGERKKRYDEWQQIVAQQLPLIYTITGHDLTAVRNKFGNMKPTVLGGAFYNIDEIYLLDHHE
jgi:peptide/nickel transport system substrate-binding protein